MTKLERIKDMLGYIHQFIENLEYGHDISDESFIIKYKDGTLTYINENDYEIGSKICLNAKKIDYIVGNCGDDSWDTENKSWLRDLVKDGDPAEQRYVDLWNEYVNSKLYRIVT